VEQVLFHTISNSKLRGTQCKRSLFSRRGNKRRSAVLNENRYQRGSIDPQVWQIFGVSQAVMKIVNKAHDFLPKLEEIQLFRL
jgi:hypothetical protein